MNVQQKIAKARKELNRDKKGKFNKKHDPFLLWGEYPRGWEMIKDMILCFLLLNILIGQVKQVDISQILAPRTLIIVNEAQAQVEPIKESQVAEFGQIDALADLIWTRESSKGKNNYSKCEEIGKVNGIGYAIPGDGSYMCFESHSEEMNTLKKWITKHIKEGMTETEMKCHYSGNNYIECL